MNRGPPLTYSYCGILLTTLIHIFFAIFYAPGLVHMQTKLQVIIVVGLDVIKSTTNRTLHSSDKGKKSECSDY
jgi:hypothetical protein